MSLVNLGSNEDDSSGHIAIIQKLSADVDWSKIISGLESINSKIEEWKTKLPERETENSQRELEAIIAVLKMHNDSETMKEIFALKRLLQDEMVKRKLLEMEVHDLKSQLEELRTTTTSGILKLQLDAFDSTYCNNLLDVFGLLRQFVMKMEKKEVGYSSAFLKADDKMILESIHPVPIDIILDSDKDIEFKQGCLVIAAETRTFFSKLNLNCDVVFSLYNRLKSRNASTHCMIDNRKYKEKGYIVERLKAFLLISSNLTEQNALGKEKTEIQQLIRSLMVNYEIQIDKLSS